VGYPAAVELAGRVALITGGGTGLGAEISRALDARGVAVGVNFSRSRLEAETIASGLSAGLAVEADVRDEVAVVAMVSRVERTLGPIDLLVNNAGVTTYAPFADLDAIAREDWETILGVNVIGVWNCARAVASGMRARGTGAIVNVASDSALTLEGSSIPYVVSKAAVLTLTETLARALAPEIHVHAVAPGWMDTPWLDRYVPEPRRQALREGREPTVPVATVAEAIVTLLESDALSGKVLRLSPEDPTRPAALREGT
jgi:3-oxoacyl-[acyl-carrier protein] reductase